MNFNHICVLGLGYIGLPTASTFAAHGLEVTGVDNNPGVVATLQTGGLHIQEPGLRTMVQAAFRSGSLHIAGEACPADAFIIAVPTPFYDDKRADLRAVISRGRSDPAAPAARQPGGAGIDFAAAHHHPTSSSPSWSAAA